MKKFLKRTLTAGMLALMACTSMSAMAEPQWVWRSEVCDYSSDNCVYKGFDAVCRYYANSRGNSAWPVIYLGGWTITGPNSLRCNADNTLDNLNFVSAAFKCPSGSSFSMDRPDGCYELVEEKDICNVSRKPTPPPGFSAWGWVACGPDGWRTVCIPPERMALLDKSDEIFRECSARHEDVHRLDPFTRCNRGVVGVENGNYDGLYRGEMKAYHIELICLDEKNSECYSLESPYDVATCIGDIKFRRDEVRERRDELENKLNNL